VVGRVGLGGSSPQRIASYLIALRPILGHAMQGWDTWTRRIGVLMEDVRHGSPSLVAFGAGRIGREQAATFRAARSQLERLQPPPSCELCQHALTRWLDSLIEACEILMAVGASGDPRRIREVRDHLAAGRVHARSFNGEYARLAEELRERVAAARSAPTGARPRRASQRRAASVSA
jgi:hypothetical protein